MLVTAAEYIENTKLEMARLAKRLEFLQKLPKNLVLESVIHRTGYWELAVSMPFETVVQKLAPAHAKMHIKGDYWEGVPENTPIDFNARHLPLIEAHGAVKWYHFLPDGTLVHVKLPRTARPTIPGFAWEPSRHSSIPRRRLKSYPAIAMVTPHQKDCAAWDAFCKSEFYLENQMQFVRIIRLRSNMNVELTLDMLPKPAPNPATLDIGGNSLVILGKTRVPEDTVSKDSPLESFSRIGRFWNVFTLEKAQRLLDFANEQRKDMNKKTQEFNDLHFGKVQEALDEFAKQYLQTAPANAVSPTVLEYWILKQTQLSVSVRDDSDYKAGKTEVSVSLVYYAQRNFALPIVPRQYDPAGFDFQNPPFYEYENNLGHFLLEA